MVGWLVGWSSTAPTAGADHSFIGSRTSTSDVNDKPGAGYLPSCRTSLPFGRYQIRLSTPVLIADRGTPVNSMSEFITWGQIFHGENVT